MAARKATENRAERPRNPRGEGARLREEILTAAAGILKKTQSPAAITLRAVAREVGIATTSIYDHFRDRQAILDALTADTYRELAAATAAARREHTEPVPRLLAGCRAYVRFARARPHLYSLLFTTNALPGAPAGSRTPSDGGAFQQRGDPGATSFRALADAVAACADAGDSTSTDPFGDAVSIWAALHGYVTLRTGIPNFPWPPSDSTFEHLVLSLARIGDQEVISPTTSHSS